MSCACQNPFQDDPDKQAKPDRYVSFIGLDCDIKAAGLMALIRELFEQKNDGEALKLLDSIEEECC